MGSKFVMALNRDEDQRPGCDDDGVSLLDFNSSNSTSTLVPAVESNQETSQKNKITSSSHPSLSGASPSEASDLKRETFLAPGTRKLKRNRLWDIGAAIIHSMLTVPFFVYCILGWRLNGQSI